MQRICICTLPIIVIVRHPSQHKILFVDCLPFVTDSIEADCLLPLPRLSFFAPLVYTPNGVLRTTEIGGISNEPTIRIPAGESVVLSCAPNHFKFQATTSVPATCKTGQTLSKLDSRCSEFCECLKYSFFHDTVVNDHEHHFRKGLGCEVRAIEEILTPVRGCDTGGTQQLIATEYGFTNPVNNRSYVLGEACYDERLGRTTFVHTTFRTDYKNYDLERVALRVSDDVNYFRQSHPLSRYKVDFLKASRVDTLNDRLTATFGFRQAPQLQSHRFVGDELLLNVQLNNVNKLGWNYMMVSADLVADRMAHALEDLRAKLAHEGVADVYVGTHGVLRTLDKSGANTEVYLTEGRFPVAKFIWMVAVARQSQKAVAYVVPNGVGQSATELCPNRCQRNGSGSAGGVLTTTTSETTTRGPTMPAAVRTASPATAAQSSLHSVHCCEYKDLKTQVLEMPQLDGSFELLV